MSRAEVTPNFRPPKIIGELDRGILEAAGKFALSRVLRTKDGLAEVEGTWNPDKGMTPLPKTLDPLVGAIIKAAIANGYPLARRVVVDMDVKEAEPGQTPRQANRWHMDSMMDGEFARLVVSDALPTQTLTAMTAGRLMNLSGEELSAVRSANAPSEEELAEMGLAIWTPEPYQIADITRRYHRSPPNGSEQTVARTFVRAALEF